MNEKDSRSLCITNINNKVIISVKDYDTLLFNRTISFELFSYSFSAVRAFEYFLFNRILFYLYGFQTSNNQSNKVFQWSTQRSCGSYVRYFMK